MTTTRFAPSPTGYLHIGNLRAALMNFLIARKSQGEFILRIDDTDAERSKQEFIDSILFDLEWLGLNWDRIEYQSKRLERYVSTAEDLREMGRFYECFETPTELDLKRKKLLNMGKPPVYDRAALNQSADEKLSIKAERGSGHWRFLLDHERVTWTDGILGKISIDAASVSDPVLIRGDGQFLYTLASVVDDIEMGVTDIVRGADHVTNTATQIQIMKALGASPPSFAHHSLLIGSQGESLSKRFGTMALKDLRASGLEPFSIISLIARLGSSQPVELYHSLEEVAEGFDLSNFGSAPTKFDLNDLTPLTQRYIQNLPFEEVKNDLMSAGVPSNLAEPFWNVIHENIKVRSDLAAWWTICAEGAEPLIDDEDKEFVMQALILLPAQPFTSETWGKWTTVVKEATGRKGKNLFMPLRKALTGMEHGPDMSAFLPFLQKIKAKV